MNQLKLRNEVVALFLVDQRLPQMTGVEFLQHTMNVFPEAKRVLLTDYADTDAVMESINRIKIDYYLTKPCEPPELNLYPLLKDLLEDWWASFRPPFEGIKVIGLRWSPRSHETKEFLARNGIPYQWLDIEADGEARRLVSFANSTRTSDTNTDSYSSSSYSSLHLPLIIFPDGSYIAEPTNSQIAEKIGLKIRAQMAFYDLIIIGAGPTGLADSSVWSIRGSSHIVS